MTEKQRRPPVAPKPSPALLQDAGIQSTASAAALRGATSAFRPALVKSSTGDGGRGGNGSSGGSNQDLSGALLAATTVGKYHPEQFSRSNAGRLHEAILPNGGRPQVPKDDPLAAAIKSAAASVSLSPSPRQSQTSRARSASAIAALAASSGSTPATGPSSDTAYEASFSGTNEHTRGSKRQALGDSRAQTQQMTLDALAGATISMAASSTQAQTQNSLDERRSFDLGRIPMLHPSSGSSRQSSPGPSATSMAAATLAIAKSPTPSAESTSVMAPPLSAHGSSESLMLLGSPGPRIKVTPPQTDSEMSSIRSASSVPPKQLQLPAPTPIRQTYPPRIVVHEQTNREPLPPLDIRTGMTLNALADAMVASSLASSIVPSRAASPSQANPPPVPRRRSKSLSSILTPGGRRTEAAPKPTPLPVRPLRQTLRKQSGGTDEADDEHTKRGRRHWRRHPNRHHEGDRKRWRDRVTERERKRYEGVWAANRGLLLNHEAEATTLGDLRPGVSKSDLVANVVVRDLWGRSRLPRDVLEEVWDLVAPENTQWLNREEFVVGMWLIDQRLKGRKLPVQVSPSVWSSVRHPQGVKISSKPL